MVSTPWYDTTLMCKTYDCEYDYMPTKTIQTRTNKPYMADITENELWRILIHQMFVSSWKIATHCKAYAIPECMNIFATMHTKFFNDIYKSTKKLYEFPEFVRFSWLISRNRQRSVWTKDTGRSRFSRCFWMFLIS